MKGKDLLETRILFVSGKGGVGKSTVSALLALYLSRKGRRTLWVEMSEIPYGSSLFPDYEPRYQIQKISDHLWGFNLLLLPAIEEYLEIRFPIPFLPRRVAENSLFQAFVQALPGMDSLITLGKIWYEDERRELSRSFWDHIVVDAPATGHFIHLLKFPRAVRSLLSSGPVVRTAREMEERLTDPRRARIYLVTTLEELPVDETLELIGRVKEETGFPLSGIFVNKTIYPLFSPRIEALRSWVSGEEDSELSSLAEDPALLRQDLDFYLDWYRIEEEQLQRLRATSLPLFFLPWIPLLSPAEILRELLRKFEGEVR